MRGSRYDLKSEASYLVVPLAWSGYFVIFGEGKQKIVGLAIGVLGYAVGRGYRTWKLRRG